jgi:hypothetical protein
MELDDRFNFDDSLADQKKFEQVISAFDKQSDNELLAVLNVLPRHIGKMVKSLEYLETVISELGILEPVEISLDERTDNWLAERRDQIKQAVSALKRQDEAFKAERDAIDEELVARFDERGTSGTRASRFTISMKIDDNYPICSDRTTFEEYLLTTKKLHLLQKRLSLSAVQEELAILNEERKAYLMRIEEASNQQSEAIAIYHELHEYDTFGPDASHDGMALHERALQDRINQLINDKILINTVKQELADRCVIPGIEISQKLTINQVKRSS